MVARTRMFLLAVLLPCVALVGIGTMRYVSNHYSVGSSREIDKWFWSIGIQSFVVIATWLIVVGSTAIAQAVARPYEQLTVSLRRMANREFEIAPSPTHVEELDDVLKALYETATVARRRLDAERTLAADVSHQLRSPLTALSLRLEEIERRTSGQDVHADAVAALGQVERLVTMVEELLTTWRSSSDRTLAAFDVQTVVNGEVHRWSEQYAAAGRSIVVNCDDQLKALGTVGVQELVLSVLLDNSLKYGAGTTFVNVQNYQTWVLIEVGDDGEGIREEVRTTLMSPGSTSGGTGLGLAWARRQVAADGGRLELRSLRPAVFGIFLIADRQSSH